MAVVTELLREEADKTLSFGDYTLADKKKVEDFKYAGDLYKVKTYKTMTKFEKNGMLLFESLPGTSVTHFNESEEGVSFLVEGFSDTQLTIGMAENTEYEVSIKGENIGILKSNVSGKLTLSVDLSEGAEAEIKVLRK